MLKVHETDWNNPKYIRAGIIPVIEQNGIKFYGFGIDNAVGMIVDFGGHREAEDADLLDTAIREYEEESLKIFGELTREKLQNCWVLLGNETVEILVPVPGTLYNYTERFRKLVQFNPDHEIQNIIWLSRSQLNIVIDSQHKVLNNTKVYLMYDKILGTLRRNRIYVD